MTNHRLLCCFLDSDCTAFSGDSHCIDPRRTEITTAGGLRSEGPGTAGLLPSS